MTLDKTRIRYALGAIGAGLLLFSGSAVLAEVYRWTDDQGVVHYSDRAGKNNAEQVKLKEGNSSRPTQSETSEPGSGEERVAQVRAEQCEKARQRLQQFQDAQKIVLTAENGDRRELDADERVQAIVQAETQVEALCEPR